MYVKVGSTNYEQISSLTFNPEADVTGSSVPVNEFSANIRTDDTIALGARASLYDDLDNLWARYWVTYAERIDEYTLQLRAQSALMMLDRDTLDPVMYASEALSTVLASVMAPISGEYTIDPSFANKTVSGYFPKQTRRVRLQWICLTIGAYVKSFFSDKMVIAPIDETETIVPLEDTYWKPKVTYKDHVTAIKVTYYDYYLQTPSVTDKWVEVNGTYYVQTQTDITLTNDDVPSGALENVVTLENVTAINQSNVGDVISNLAKYYFKRTELDLDAIDNAAYVPAQKVIAFADRDTMLVGYISRCAFSFGVQAKASMHLMAIEEKARSALLVVTYVWNQTVVEIRQYRLPVGYEYEIDNHYIEMTLNNHRYTFRPLTAKVSGTIQGGTNVQTVNVEIALDLFRGDLHVISVDGVTLSDGTAVIS